LIDTALQVLRGGAVYIATNADKTFPLEAGRVSPGAGTIVAALTACSGVEPFIVGKPNPFILTSYFDLHEIKAEDVLMVGDRMDTDIECGRAAGCATALVLTGISTQAVAGVQTCRSLLELLD
jgi:HAD superfamily hydrolase (TIGR01450 family)